MLFIERSNRTERLLDGLTARLMQPGRDPLAPATIVVQGPGMERWLAQSIARRHGICANIEFLFPRAFLDRVFESALGEPSNPAWAREGLVFEIAHLLDAARDDEDFAPVARHLEAIDGDWRLTQLSSRLAALFEQYVDFREEWVFEWTNGATGPDGFEARWQAKLFRSLASKLGPGHFADRARAFAEAVGEGDSGGVSKSIDRAFPDRIEIFAVSTLPPLYLRSLDQLASVRDLHLSVLSPSRDYWADLWREVREADLEPASEQSTLPGLFGTPEPTPTARLLASLGRLGGDFQRNLEDLANAHDDGEERHVSPVAERSGLTPGGRITLLEKLQSDLLDDPGIVDADGRGGAFEVQRDDDSIRIHLVHGPRRELEVALAELRNAFERDETLAPEDVIVMAPRIDEIAADIESVFGADGPDGAAIPYRIADRGALRRSPVAETFVAALSLLTGRITRTELMDWLAREPARERFDLEEEAVERLSEWAERAGIRFGLDADHRAALELERDDRHSVSDGLARLALAHAMGSAAVVAGEVAPAPLDPFSDPEVLGALGDLEETLRGARRFISAPRTIRAWAEGLEELLEALCDRSDQNAHEHTTIRGVLQALADKAEEAGFDLPIRFEAMREQVIERLESTPPPQAFLAGGVTFCELVPLRAIPFRVVVILGLADEAFPRGRPAPGFDLMARAPRPGDRDTRTDDRYLFLEALLSARDRLILTIPARDVRDGSDRPPSIVVSELIEAIEGSYRLAPSSPGANAEEEEDEASRKEALRGHLVVKHPLQPFSPRYFECGDSEAPASAADARLRGRDREAFEGARARRAALESDGGIHRRFLDAPLDVPDGLRGESEGLPALDLEAMIERVLRSTRYFARDRLGLRLPSPVEGVGDLDPFEFAPLEAYALGNALLQDLSSGASIEEAGRRLRAQAGVPAGISGRLAVEALQEEATLLARIADGRREGDPVPDDERVISLDVEGLGPVRLHGLLDRLTRAGRLESGFARLGRRSELALWIRHLFLCVCVEEGLAVAPLSVLVGRSARNGESERVVLFEGVESAREMLGDLFRLAWHVDEAPIPFFPRASRRFAVAVEKNAEKAWRDAQQAFHGGSGSRFDLPEAEEELEYALLWEGLSPLEPSQTEALGSEFDVIARTFFAPLLEARKALRS